MPIVLRSEVNRPLTYGEVDGNFTYLETNNALGWRDNIIELKVDSSSPNAPTLNPFRGSILAWTFPGGEMTEASAAWHIDHDYAMGTPLYFHVHWATPSTDIGTVRWGFEYTIAKGHQQQAFPTTSTVYIEQATTGTAYMHMIAELSEANAIPGTNIEPDTVIMVRLFRDGGNAADTLNQPVFGLFLDLHYQADHTTTPNKSPPFW